MLFLCSYYGFSQQYPVQVTTTLVPPYSLYLSDYTAIGSNNLQVLVNLLELDRPNLQIKFRITIEGAGITLRTSPAFMPRPLNIQGGVPELFTGADLTSYFNPDHLDFSGITRAAFKRSGQLPEGFYTFTVEVLEYNRNVRISNQTVSYAWIVLNDPPLLNTPFNGDKVIATDPQNIMFSWTPRHTASPNAAFSTEYEFRLVELYPGQTNPDIAIRSSNSIYTTTTTLTSLNYGIIEPTLIPGKKYAFRVRAYDTSGRDLFKNDGYSETYVFQYGDACGTFEGIAAKTLDPQRARISWEPEQHHTGCVINYRKNGKEDWFTQEVNGSYGIVAQLAGRTTYEYQLIPQCGTILGEKSPVLTFTTPEVDESGFVCGAPIPEFDASDVPLMKPLLPLDVIQVGDWTVNLLNVTANGDGTYGGAGYAAVPNFNLANVRVVFDRILVNEDYQVVAGDIRTVYSEDSRFVLDIQKKVEEPEVVEGPEDVNPELTEDLVADVLVVEIPADIGEVVFSGGLLEVYDESGNLIEDADLDLPPEGEELTITDSNGDTWVVDGEGMVKSSSDPDIGNPNDIQFVREQLIKELLQHYKDEISVWLENQDKGPLDDHILSRLLSLPDCLPENEEDLNVVLEKIEAFLEDPQSLMSLLEEDEENEESFGKVAEKIQGKNPPYKDELSEEEWKELVEMICWYLTEEGKKPELVTIEPITDNQFAAGIDDDKLEIKYSIKSAEKYNIKKAKLEVYKNDGTLGYVNSEIEIGEEKVFEWDGMMNQGDESDKYIRYDESPFKIKITAIENENDPNKFENETFAIVHQFADEWTDVSNHVKDRISIVNAPGITSKFEYYLLLRDQMIENIGARNIGESGPLGYMDTNEVTFTFLGKEIRTHKNYKPILAEIEKTIINNGDYGYYENKYPIGSYTIRYMNYTKVISDHSFGLAIDIDESNNPQILSRTNLFLMIVTNVDFWYTTLSLEQMRKASDHFKKSITTTSLNEIIEGFEHILSYGSDETKFLTTQDIIDGKLHLSVEPIYRAYNSIFLKTSSLVNELWFKENITDDMLTELRVEIPKLCNEKVNQITELINQIILYKFLLNNGYKKAYSMATNFQEEYTYLDSYMSNMINALNDYREAYKLIIREIEETKDINFIPADFDITSDFPVIETFDSKKINNFLSFQNRVYEILKSIGNLSLNQYIDWLGASGTINALTKLGMTGFYNLENELVNYFLNSDKINWGGNWPKNRDWMHFQPSHEYYSF